jgi:hypothetical protein
MAARSECDAAKPLQRQRFDTKSGSARAIERGSALKTFDNSKSETWCVYTIVNKSTGQQYHGQTKCGVENRFKQHLSAARHGSSYKLADAIREHGEDSFYLAGWIEVGDRNKASTVLNDLERGMISHTKSKERGYNGPRPRAREPKRSKRHTVTVDFPIDMHKEIREIAVREQRNFGAQVRFVLKQWIEAQSRSQA